MDFHATDTTGGTLLLQVCANAGDPGTLHREIRALVAAHHALPEAKPILLLLDPLPREVAVPAPIEVTHALPWFLQPVDT